jgi:mannose-6-phosphate isomerase
MRPVVLPPNGIERFYRGGPAIAALRGTRPPGARVPEDWVGSTTTVFGEEELGLSRLPSGELLRDEIAADPAGFLGADHAARRGPDPALLVKLLDAGERLPVHVHPDGAFAHAKLGVPYGKTEAWIVVEATAPDTIVHVGFREDVSPETLERWVEEQDGPALLDALNPCPVRPWDTLFVPAGVPHAIGEGLLIVELQEPTDLSVLLEWDGFGIDDPHEASLGLGWETALDCVDRSAHDPEVLRGPRPEGLVARLLPREADPFFRAEWVAPAPEAELEPGFAILVVLEGGGMLEPEDGGPLELRRGEAILLPHGAGRCRVSGEVILIACRPPAPPANGAGA